jgi:hypothetical protein
MNKLTRHLTAWIASLAILVAAFAPFISHAMSPTRNVGPGWVEICTYTGTKLINVEGKQDPASSAPAEKGAHFKHCPFCSMHAKSAVQPPAADFIFPVASGKQPRPPLYYQSHSPLFTWAARQSRAPPANS